MFVWKLKVWKFVSEKKIRFITIIKYNDDDDDNLQVLSTFGFLGKVFLENFENTIISIIFLSIREKYLLFQLCWIFIFWNFFHTQTQFRILSLYFSLLMMTRNQKKKVFFYLCFFSHWIFLFSRTFSCSSGGWWTNDEISIPRSSIKLYFFIYVSLFCVSHWIK